MGGKRSKTPYEERSDGEKLRSNWTKATGLYAREDWSAAIVRAATVVELAANIYIRQFFGGYDVPGSFIDTMLSNANGIHGKFHRLVKPAAQVDGQWEELSKFRRKIQEINEHRNGVTHSGKFKSEEDATMVFTNALEVIVCLASAETAKLKLPF